MSRKAAVLAVLGLTACASHTPRETVVYRPVPRPVVVRERVVRPDLDRNFLVRAASRGQFEVESSRLALRRSRHGEASQFARIMVRDHQRANRRLEMLANAKAVRIPVDMMPDHRRQLEELRTLPHDQFIDGYTRMQANEYRNTLALYARCARYCRDPDVQNYAAEMLPMLREHERYVYELRAVARR